MAQESKVKKPKGKPTEEHEPETMTGNVPYPKE